SGNFNSFSRDHTHGMKGYNVPLNDQLLRARNQNGAIVGARLQFAIYPCERGNSDTYLTIDTLSDLINQFNERTFHISCFIEISPGCNIDSNKRKAVPWIGRAGESEKDQGYSHQTLFYS